MFAQWFRAMVCALNYTQVTSDIPSMTRFIISRFVNDYEKSSISLEIVLAGGFHGILSHNFFGKHSSSMDF